MKRRDDPEGEADLVALAERVHAETRKPRDLVREVEVAGRVEGVDLVGARDGREDVLHVPRRERLGLLHVAERAVAAQHGRPPGLQVDVARTELDGLLQKGVEIHARGIGAERRVSLGTAASFATR